MVPVIWLIAAAVLAIGELLIMDFTLLMLGVAALVTAGVAVTGIPVWATVCVFGVASLGTILLVRPVLRRRFVDSSEITAFTPRELEGLPAVVLAQVTSGDTTGQVRVNGEIWSARAAHPGDTFAEGDRVQVVSIDGTTAVVWKGV
jgi:membrane protein implicated in regulation of membrane protease activity